MKNEYECQREKLIVLVHWTFLSRKFLIMKNESVRKSFFQSQLINLFFRIKEIMNWTQVDQSESRIPSDPIGSDQYPIG